MHHEEWAALGPPPEIIHALKNFDEKIMRNRILAEELCGKHGIVFK